MYAIVNFLRGYYVVEVEGAFPERFLNVCAQNDVTLWHLKRSDKEHLRARMHRSDWEKFREASLSSANHVSVVAEHGVPLYLRALWRRGVLLGGFLSILITLYVLSLYVWEIDITGNERVDENVILKQLEEVGVHIGTYAPHVNLAEIKNEMLMRMDDLSWITVNIKGSRASVEVRERVLKPPIVEKDTPCNIVAAKDGVIVKMDTLEGSAQVAIGQTVKRGQLLVSGIIDSQQVGARYVHARADVEARTWLSLSAGIPCDLSAKSYTGRRSKRYALVFAGYETHLGFSDFSTFENYDKLLTRKTLSLFGLTLPVALVIEEHVEYKPVSARLKRDSAEKILRNALERRLEDSLGEGEVLDKQYKLEEVGGGLVLRLTTECQEKITLIESLTGDPLRAMHQDDHAAEDSGDD